MFPRDISAFDCLWIIIRHTFGTPADAQHREPSSQETGLLMPDQ
jgi:hypothetical protein